MSRAKEWVKRRYGNLVRQPQPCCEQSPDCCQATPTSAEAIGYQPEDVTALPASTFSLGCGNPLALASISPGETVLDLGSGVGLDVFLATRRVGPTGRVIGVDLTPEMIERARGIAERSSYTNVEFRLGDIEELPVEDGSVDLVISNCVLNLVPDKSRAFREIVRVLKPGGRVAISDIVLDGPLPESLQASEDAYSSCISGAISRQDYLAGLAAAGLQEVRVASEADATPLLTGNCCGEGLDESALAEVMTSIQVTGRKPHAAGGT